MNIISKEYIDTNNAWGFGGKSGYIVKYDNGIETFKGELRYRHAPSSKVSYVYVECQPKFSIAVCNKNKKPISNLNNVDIISIFKSPNGSHWQAFSKDMDEFEMYGESYVLHKKIKL